MPRRRRLGPAAPSLREGLRSGWFSCCRDEIGGQDEDEREREAGEFKVMTGIEI